MDAPRPIAPAPRPSRPPPDLGVAARVGLPLGTAAWGVWALASVLSPAWQHFSRGPGFRAMAWCAPEYAWGALALALGALDLALLAQRMPARVRYPVVFAIALFWTLVTIGFACSDITSFGAPVYASFAYSAFVRTVDLGADA